jgi:type I restriction enzyme S subunit
MNRTLKAIGQVIFRRWFVDFEFPNKEGKPYKSSGGEMILNEELKREIPKGWKVSEIGDELETVLGGTPDTSNKLYWEGGDIPWINSGSINEFPVIKPTAYITKLGLDNSAAKLMPTKTVVIPFVISVGKEIKISITALETSGNQSVLGILENDKMPSEFIYYWISYIKEDIYSWATGGAQQHINKGNVNNSPILIPESRIIGLFKEVMSPAFERIMKNSHEILTLTEIRDRSLPLLMSGKIRVPSQEDHKETQ